MKHSKFISADIEVYHCPSFFKIIIPILFHIDPLPCPEGGKKKRKKERKKTNTWFNLLETPWSS